MRPPLLFGMKIVFNGEGREVRSGMTIAELLDELSLDPKRVAVEVNLDLAPRDRHAQTPLQEGDQLEVVTLVGGG
jgi:thiamine biosynthesis protein ThiS